MWKNSIVKGFGIDFYNALFEWKGASPQELALVVTLAAQEPKFNFTPIAQDNNLVLDSKLKLEMVAKAGRSPGAAPRGLAADRAGRI